MTCLSEVESEMRRVIYAFWRDNSLLQLYPKTTGFEDRSLNYENLVDLAGNHLFDDHSERFGITAKEGEKVRAYLITDFDYGGMIELHKAFSGILEPEGKEYLDSINARRARHGLDPLIVEM